MSSLEQTQDAYSKLSNIENDIKTVFGSEFFTNLIYNDLNLILQTEDFIMLYVHEDVCFNLSFTINISPQIAALNTIIMLDHINKLDIIIKDENYYDSVNQTFVYGDDAYKIMKNVEMENQGIKECHICNYTYKTAEINVNGYCSDCDSIKHKITWN
jgi:hypothetical protein